MHRPTREKILSQARTHVFYGWSMRPGSWDRNEEWTDEDVEIYRAEYKRLEPEYLKDFIVYNGSTK